MSGADLREALAEEYPDWHPEVQRLVQAHVVKLEAAIRWALGETGEFTPLHASPPNYWWRTELRRRAALAGDGGGA